MCASSHSQGVSSRFQSLDHDNGPQNFQEHNINFGHIMLERPIKHKMEVMREINLSKDKKKKVLWPSTSSTQQR